MGNVTRPANERQVMNVIQKGGKDHHSGELVKGGEKVGDAAASFHQHHQFPQFCYPAFPWQISK